MIAPGELRTALTAASRAYKSAGADALRELGLHPGQDFLLDALLVEGPMTAGDLARRLRVEGPTVSRMSQRMESGGLVSRLADAADGRRTLISLTPRGRRLAAKVPRVLDEVLEGALTGLSDVERRQFRRALEHVAANLGWGDGLSE